MATLLVGVSRLALAQDATWSSTPTASGPIGGTFDYNNNANWTNPATVPGSFGTAFFGATSGPNISFSSGFTQVGGWTFNPGASDYTFTLSGAGSQVFIFNGPGIVINGGSATINNNARNFFFQNNSTAGSAAINNSGRIGFSGNSTGGGATITNTSGSALIDFSLSTGPNNDRVLSVGSLAGSGDFFLGANQLTVGSNGLSTTVSGIITDCFSIGFGFCDANGSGASAGGSLVKIGSGTLTLTGVNTYTGGTTVDGGTIDVGTGGALGAGSPHGPLVAGQSGTGTLTIEPGASVFASLAQLGRNEGSTGTVTVTGPGASLNINQGLEVGLFGNGSVTIQNGATVSSTSLQVAEGTTSTGTLTITGSSGSQPSQLTINNGGTFDIGVFGNATVNVTNGGVLSATAPGSFLDVGVAEDSGHTAALNITSGGTVFNNGPAVIGVFNEGQATVNVSGKGSLFEVIGQQQPCTGPQCGLEIGHNGLGVLTIGDGGEVISPQGVVLGGSFGGRGTINIGAAVGDPLVGPGFFFKTPSITTGDEGVGLVVFNHNDTTGSYVFSPVIEGPTAVQVDNGTTVFNQNEPYTGPTTINGGTLVIGDFSHQGAALSGGGEILVEPRGTLAGYGSVTTVTNMGTIAVGSATPGFSSFPFGTFTIHGDYKGVEDSQLLLRTFLNGDGSPSDVLVIDHGFAGGTTDVQVTNAPKTPGGPLGEGALTTGNGILVVETTDSGTTQPGLFHLLNPVIVGPFEYFLFRGAIDPAPDNWFLRSSITCIS